MIDKIVGNDFGRAQRARRARCRDAPSHKSAGMPIWTNEVRPKGETQECTESQIGRNTDLDERSSPEGRDAGMRRVNALVDLDRNYNLERWQSGRMHWS